MDGPLTDEEHQSGYIPFLHEDSANRKKYKGEFDNINGYIIDIESTEQVYSLLKERGYTSIKTPNNVRIGDFVIGGDSADKRWYDIITGFTFASDKKTVIGIKFTSYSLLMDNFDDLPIKYVFRPYYDKAIVNNHLKSAKLFKLTILKRLIAEEGKVSQDPFPVKFQNKLCALDGIKRTVGNVDYGRLKPNINEELTTLFVVEDLELLYEKEFVFAYRRKRKQVTVIPGMELRLRSNYRYPLLKENERYLIKTVNYPKNKSSQPTVEVVIGSQKLLVPLSRFHVPFQK
jgi:hypothetical protein